MKNYIKEVLLLIITLIPVIVMLKFWSIIPEQMPVHWNSNFEIDGYSSKLKTFYMILGLNLGLYITLLVAPLIDPKKQNIELSKKAYFYIRLATTILISIISLSIVLFSTEFSFEVSSILSIGIPLLFMIIGNFLPKMRKNYFIGIRTPWTLANEEVWKKTHLLGGKIWFFVGLFGVIWGILAPIDYLNVFIGLVLISTIYIVIYSYLEFKKLETDK